MSVTSDLLFSFLRGIFYPKSSVELDITKIDEDYVMLAQGLMFFAQCVNQCREFASALANGDLGIAAPPADNELASSLKTLQANLKHLTWQSQQVAKGDYKQRVDFMGEFADAFNTMVEQLSDRQTELENEVESSRKYAEAMVQSNLLFGELTKHIPEQIFVVSLEKFEILLTNNLAQQEIDSDPNYIIKLMQLLPLDVYTIKRGNCNIICNFKDCIRYLQINTYQIVWHKVNAIALIINDVSEEKKQLLELEDVAYRDALTGSFNRFFGLLTLNEWLDAKMKFALIFVDLDNLKYVNDKFGHKEGDVYITKISDHLHLYSGNATVCRLGGDEFMVLVPDEDFENAQIRMEKLHFAIQNDEYLEDKDLFYSISYGIVAVDENTKLSASEALSVADERMYSHKRQRKKERQSSM